MSLFTTDTLPAYLAERATEIGVFAADASLTAEELHGGNLNYAFHVTDGNTAVFVKQVSPVNPFGNANTASSCEHHQSCLTAPPLLPAHLMLLESGPETSPAVLPCSLPGSER